MASDGMITHSFMLSMNTICVAATISRMGVVRMFGVTEGSYGYIHNYVMTSYTWLHTYLMTSYIWICNNFGCNHFLHMAT